MKFGLSFLPDATPATKSPTAYFADALELSVLADRFGLGYIKMTEHYIKAYGGYCPSPLGFLAAVAAKTENIRLMTGCLLPAFSHPMKIAAECAMVDVLSQGRLEAGFARAYLPYEFDCFGVDLDESRARFEAGVEAVIRLWTSESVTMETPFFDLRDMTLLPPPVQQPCPPVWVAAVRSRQSFAWLAECGFGLLITSALTPPEELAELVSIYRESFRPSELAPERKAAVTLSLPLYLAPTDREAFDEGERFLDHYQEVWAESAESWNAVQSRDYPRYTGLVHAIRNLTAEKMRTRGHAIVGCPARAVDDIHRLQEVLAVDEIIWQVDIGAMPLEPARRTVVSFVEDVLPELKLGHSVKAVA